MTAANYSMKLEKHIIPAHGKLAVCSVKAKNIYAFIEVIYLPLLGSNN